MRRDLTELCQELKNFFVIDDKDKHIGTFTITDGTISPSVDIKDGQYYRVVGSLSSDGVYMYGDQTDVPKNETFDGAIWLMHVPEDVIILAGAIKTYKEKNAEISPYTSESFGGYSYTRATSKDGNVATWQTVFAIPMSRWRKVRL